MRAGEWSHRGKRLHGRVGEIHPTFGELQPFQTRSDKADFTLAIYVAFTKTRAFCRIGGEKRPPDPEIRVALVDGESWAAISRVAEHYINASQDERPWMP